nr:SHOCT domain-containing protein [Natrialba sp. INN-245]
MLTVGLAMGLLFLGWSNFWIVFVVGFAFVLPAAVQLAQWYEGESSDPIDNLQLSQSSPSGEQQQRQHRQQQQRQHRQQQQRQQRQQQQALETLRERYASGEIDDPEFEHRVTHLLETESIDDAATFYQNDDETAAEREPELERDD